ncbi:MAG TPA: hypothetical protein VK081_10295 [Planctomycetota bacterium]|nr:hypothetical protein [Planctomycetota bacterium]
MSRKLTLPVFSVLLAVAGCAIPRQAPAAAAPSGATPSPAEADAPGPVRGDWEVFLAGVAQNEETFNHGSAGAVLRVGRYVHDEVLVSARQILFFADDEVDTSIWSTRFEADIVPAWFRRVRPFLGASLGYTGGESVNETGILGVHGGVKVFPNRSGFFQVLGGYDMFFTKTEDRTEQLRRGQWMYSLGIGLCF